MMNKKRNPCASVPQLACFDTGEQYAGWCPWCKVWHFHGRGPGHRVAHCINDISPFKADGGYDLGLARLPAGAIEILVKGYLSNLTTAKLKILLEECGAVQKLEKG